MAGNLIQVGADGKVRVKSNGVVVAGVGDPCCCATCVPCSKVKFSLSISGFTACPIPPDPDFDTEIFTGDTFFEYTPSAPTGIVSPRCSAGGTIDVHANQPNDGWIVNRYNKLSGVQVFHEEYSWDFSLSGDQLNFGVIPTWEVTEHGPTVTAMFCGPDVNTPMGFVPGTYTFPFTSATCSSTRRFAGGTLTITITEIP